MRGKQIRIAGLDQAFGLAERRSLGVRRKLLLAMSVLISAAAAPCAARAGDLDQHSLKVLYSFCSQANCTDGSEPVGTIARYHGIIYGTTKSGGVNGGGTVFDFNGTGEQVIWSFCDHTNCTDGQAPVGGVIADTKGNIYGTTEYGGNYGVGTVFEITQQNYAYYQLASFSNNGSGGNYPQGGLLRDSQTGDLYGTTPLGGNNGQGVVFQLTAGSGVAYSIYYFCAKAGCTDGANPVGGLVRDSSGNLFGVTQNGGANNSGTVFKLWFNTRTGQWEEKVLYDFCFKPVCSDGASPAAGLTLDGGNLYGTAYQGGDGGYGVIFTLRSDGSGYTVVHSFCFPTTGCKDGQYPITTLASDGAGNLYGTTLSGSGGAGGAGTVFSLTSGSETPLAYFCGGTCKSGKNNGSVPSGDVIASYSKIFGTTANGGANGGGGEIYEYKLSTPSHASSR